MAARNQEEKRDKTEDERERTKQTVCATRASNELVARVQTANYGAVWNLFFVPQLQEYGNTTVC